MKVTFEALNKGIEQCRVGNRISDIGHAVQEYVENNGFSRLLKIMWAMELARPCMRNPRFPTMENRQGPRIVEGMCLALEPMVNMGEEEVRVLEDGWTVVTKDGKFSAHFEDTVAILANGPENLTRI